MFIETVDRSTLRQGDVVRDIVFPIARFDSTRVLGKPVRQEDGSSGIDVVSEGSPERPYQIIQVQGTLGFCAVLSQCCDVDASQNPPPHSLVLCKVLPVPKSIAKRQSSHDTLIANLDPYGDRKAFIGNFWFGSIPGETWEFMADFGQVMTAPWADYSQVLSRKIAELEDLHRAKFRVKVGAHFGRVTEEDRAAGFEDPYQRGDES
jgi:hypothetical protein